MAVRLLAGLASAALGLVGSSRADDGDRPEAVPYRPTVSTPAQLSAPHWLEGEFGGQFLKSPSSDDGTGGTRSSIPYTLKYAFSDDWGVRIGGEALVRVSDDGHRQTGFGDTNVILKRRLAIDDASAFGLEVGAMYPTTRPALHLGSGKPDYSANGIYSADVAGWHGDVNLIGTRLGGHDAMQSRWQTLAAIALSHPISDRWQVTGELSGTRQSGVGSTAQFLGGLLWSVRPDLVLDLGGARGLNHATAPWQAFAGMTVVIGRID